MTPVDFKPYFPINNPGEWILLVLLTLACFFNFLVAGSTFVIFMRRRMQQFCGFPPRYRAQSGRSERLLEAAVSVVVPCYLPNEQYLINETIDHILHKLHHAGPLTLYIVYNSPSVLPIEEALRARERTQAGVPPGRTLIVQRVEGSTSKAENLNAVFEVIQDRLTAIYDADHHPDPESLELLLRKLQNHQVDCVQGSTYIRNTSSGLMSRVIDAEFFVTYFVYFMSLQFIARTAFFGGSNAVWRTEALQGEKFSTSMQTEDIDFAARAILKDKRIRFCPEARSGELAPSSISALYKQRMRWAMGWEQVTLAHLSTVRQSNIPCSRKMGVVYMLPMRWLLAFLSVVAAIVSPILCLVFPPQIWPLALDFVFTIGFLESTLLVACTLLESIYHEAFVQCIFVAAFMLCSPLYLGMQVVMLLASMYRIHTGSTGNWVVTSRAGPTSAAGGLAQPNSASVGGARASDSLEAGRTATVQRVAPPLFFNGLERFCGPDVDAPLPRALGPMRHTL
eukprot:CAMPEP_0119431404 /NCGR_PEP_ID=MMETSP1335-20130426/45850_1 /TAXON_ID=259385 /ORGANISM="Chrysoculter rhomboideus, Strain RCC1486" /LENGTH=508 /DNA_ID=CAMNT_0007457197 /DNA_START=184 /DNA_END=1710 /DNA_ORIENTATION=-